MMLGIYGIRDVMEAMEATEAGIYVRRDTLVGGGRKGMDGVMLESESESEGFVGMECTLHCECAVGYLRLL